MKKTYKIVGDYYLSDGVCHTEDIALGFNTKDEADYFMMMNGLVEYGDVRVVDENEETDDYYVE